MIQKHRASARIAVIVLAMLAALGVVSAQSPDLAAKAQRGKEAMSQGNFDLAAKTYAELVQAIPDNPGLLLNLGMAEHMGGHDREAIPHLQAALKVDPNIFPANLFLGASFLRLGQEPSAIAPLTKAVELQPDAPDARAMLGDALLGAGRPSDAVAHYQKLTELKPGVVGGWLGLGQSYETLAQQAFEKLEKTAAESAYSMALIAGVRVTQQQYSSAFYLYRQALEKQPGMRGIHQAVADIYRRTGHADWAATEEQKETSLPALDCASEKLQCAWRDKRFSDLLRLSDNADGVQASFWRIRAYNGLAAQAFAKIGELPPSPQRHQLMSDLHRRNGRFVEAVEELRAALKLAPGRPDLERELATALYLNRDYNAAAELTAKLLQQRPDDPELNWFRGDSLMYLQKAEEAVAPLNKAVQVNPKLLPAHLALGRAYMQLGQDSAALPHLKAALPIDQDGSVHYQLGQAYRSTGQLELAKQELSKSQQIQRETQAQQREAQEEIKITPP